MNLVIQKLRKVLPYPRSDGHFISIEDNIKREIFSFTKAHLRILSDFAEMLNENASGKGIELFPKTTMQIKKIRLRNRLINKHFEEKVQKLVKHAGKKFGKKLMVF